MNTFTYACQKFKMKTEIFILKNQITAYHNCFFMLCGLEDSCFYLINVKVLGSFWLPYQQMIFLGDPDCITGLYFRKLVGPLQMKII